MIEPVFISTKNEIKKFVYTIIINGVCVEVGDIKTVNISSANSTGDVMIIKCNDQFSYNINNGTKWIQI
jgi:hypothetical protein